MAIVEEVEEGLMVVVVGVLQQSPDRSKLSLLYGIVLQTAGALSRSESRTSPSPHGSCPLKNNHTNEKQVNNEVHVFASPLCTALKQMCSVSHNMHSEHKYSTPEITTASNSNN